MLSTILEGPHCQLETLRSGMLVLADARLCFAAYFILSLGKFNYYSNFFLIATYSVAYMS